MGCFGQALCALARMMARLWRASDYTAAMSLLISRILHAGYLFEAGATRIAFDPVFENPFSRNCHAFPPVAFDQAAIRSLRLDAVFISHLHDDHCSLDSLDLLDRATPVYMYCVFDELFAMIAQLGFRHVTRLAIDTPVRIGAIEVTPREALDVEVDAMFQVRADGVNVLNVVDAWIADEVVGQLAAMGPWDMVLWPFQPMRELAVIAPSRAAPHVAGLPEGWIDQLRALAPRYVVPSSCQFVQEDWSWYNHAMFPMTYRAFAEAVTAALPATGIVRLDPGVSIVLSADGIATAPPLAWVLPVGPQDVDFDFRPGIAPPSTADIARRFAALDAAQEALVLAFCEDGLLVKYREMELPEDSYFSKRRNWRLRLYDHRGACRQFDYVVEGDTIALSPAALAPGWLTEVAISKVYAALALGESLTSMYVRINDALFDAASENDLHEADIVDDPLIRCLFNEVVGAYQAAQLHRLISVPARAPASPPRSADSAPP
jgi:hypothetical protein